MLKHLHFQAWHRHTCTHLSMPATLPTSSLTVHTDVASTNVCDLEQIT